MAGPTGTLDGGLAQLQVLLEGQALPTAVAVRVERVLRALRDLEGLDRGTARDAAGAVLPRLLSQVRGYQRLPRGYADGRAVAGGRTALLVLVDDLDLTGLTLDRVHDALARGDHAALAEHRAALEGAG